jgi:hypothetical protein
MWRIGWAPNSIPIYVHIQQDATLHSLFISGNCSTCFGWYFHPSSGAHTTVSTAPDICHTVTAICRYRGRVGTGLSVLWVAYEVCASAVVMLDTASSEVVWRVLATHSIRQFPLHFPSLASQCAITFQLDYTCCYRGWDGTINSSYEQVIPTLQPTRCTCYLKLFILVKLSTCFGHPFRPSSGAQNCVYSNGICQTAAAVWHITLQYTQFWAPDDGRKDRPKHVERLTNIINLR